MERQRKPTSAGFHVESYIGHGTSYMEETKPDPQLSSDTLFIYTPSFTLLANHLAEAYYIKSLECFFLDEPMSSVASDSSSWLTGLDPNVIFGHGRPSTSTLQHSVTFRPISYNCKNVAYWIIFVSHTILLTQTSPPGTSKNSAKKKCAKQGKIGTATFNQLP